MKIGNLELNGYAALAPMAGIADRAMRELCIGYGAAYVVGELTSAKGVSVGGKKSFELLSVFEPERPMGIQLFGDSERIMAQAAEQALKNKPDFIDINMGCPARKVVSNNGGSALMKNPELAANIVCAVKAVSAVPVTVKMRAGWDEDSLNAPLLARLCEQAGADAITVHGRTRQQMYAPPVNLDIIREVKLAVDIPVIANGDITNAFEAAQMYEYTGCDLVMIGRAACGAPWIFSQVNAYLSEGRIIPEPPLAEKLRVLLKQVKMMVEYKGDERTAMMQARKHASLYMRGLAGASGYRRECGMLKTFSQLEALCTKVYESVGNANNR